MKNVTITLPEKVYKYARILAAKKSMGLSSLIRDLLSNMMEREENMSSIVDSYLAQEPYLSTENKKIKREDIYDRKVFR